MPNPLPSAALIAIAKNEAFYLTEWIAYHFAVGFNEIIIFDNDSTDETAELLDRIARLEPRLRIIDWPSRTGISPQYTAYNHAIRQTSCDWMAFLDIDEFLVPWRHPGIAEYLGAVAEDISEIHVNWRGFGSGGRAMPDYELVTEAFTACSAPDWVNNLHYKSLVRRAAIDEVLVHYARLNHGRRCLTDFTDVAPGSEGIADRAIHDPLQVNHYQCKTYPEFRRRMNNGNVFIGLDDAGKFLDGSRMRFLELDRNEDRDERILPRARHARIAFETLEQFLPGNLRAASLRSNWIREAAAAPAQDIETNGVARRPHYFITRHGTILCRAEDGPELAQCAFFDSAPCSPPISVSLSDEVEPKAESLRNCIAQAATLPENISLARAEILPGRIAGSAAIRFRDRYLTAHSCGRLTLNATQCGTQESFLLLPQPAFHLITYMKSKVWQAAGVERPILPSEIWLAGDFTLRLAEHSILLRELPSGPMDGNPSSITLKRTDGVHVIFQVMEGWREALVESWLHGIAADTRSNELAATLAQAGFEGYGIDFRESTATFHLPRGPGLHRGLTRAFPTPAQRFDRQGVIAAAKARSSEAGLGYWTFCEQLIASGCAGMMVSFRAKRVLYFGRGAETLVEA